MKKQTLILLLILLTGCASNTRVSADMAVGTDLVTTYVGITSGAAVEANPLLQSPAAIVAAGVLRFLAISKIDKLEEPDRTKGLTVVSSVTWGVAASNVATMLAASNPIGFAVGAIVGISAWKYTENERSFMETCVAYKQQYDPRFSCSYNYK